MAKIFNNCERVDFGYQLINKPEIYQSPMENFLVKIWEAT